MFLALEKFNEFTKQEYSFYNKSKFIQSNGVKINVLGNLDLLPFDVKEAALKCIEMTKHNNKYYYFIKVLF